MKKQIILSAVVAALTAPASASSLFEASEAIFTGSGKMVEAVSGMAGTTLKLSHGSVVSSAKSLAGLSKAIVDESVFIIETPSEASKKYVNASGEAISWAVTTSGELVKLTWKGSKAFIEDPSAATSKAVEASGRAIELSVDASGRALGASGDFLSENYGEDARLLVDGSGEIYEVSEGSVVASFEGSKAVLTFVGEHSVDPVLTSVEGSAKGLSALVVTSYQVSKETFKAARKSGYQFNR